MNLYLLSQDINNRYDTYDSCIVAAEDSHDAVIISPTGSEAIGGVFSASESYGSWVINISDVMVKYIGEAAKDIKRGVILSSYNAG